jgi:hypothetical protein
MSGSSSPAPGVQSFDGEADDGDAGLEGGADEEAGEEADDEMLCEDEGAVEEAAVEGPEEEFEEDDKEVGPASVGRVGTVAPLEWSHPASASSPAAAAIPTRIVRLVLILFSIRHPGSTVRI